MNKYLVDMKETIRHSKESLYLVLFGWILIFLVSRNITEYSALFCLIGMFLGWTGHVDRVNYIQKIATKEDVE